MRRARGAVPGRDIPLHADPARSPFRIYRDTRFSKDKTPYKTAAAASFSLGGRRRRGGGGPIAHGERPRERRLLPPPAGRDLRRRRRVAPRASRGSTRSGSGSSNDSTASGAIVEAPAFADTFGTVSDDGESLKRVPPGLSGRPPGRRPAAQEERDLRPPAVRRRGAEPGAARRSSRTRSPPARRSCATSPRSSGRQRSR